MNHLTVQHAATKWDVTERRVQQMCESGQIVSITRFDNRSLMILEDAKTPVDLRHETNKHGIAKGGNGQ